MKEVTVKFKPLNDIIELAKKSGDIFIPITVIVNENKTTNLIRDYNGDSFDYKLDKVFISPLYFDNIPQFHKDQKVLVWNYHGESKECRYYSHYENNKHYCFSYGATSWSSDRTVTDWLNCEAAPE